MIQTKSMAGTTRSTSATKMLPQEKAPILPIHAQDVWDNIQAQTFINPLKEEFNYS